MCNYGEHPMDRYDLQSQEPEFSGYTCAQCGDDLQLGMEVWRYANNETCEEHLVCSVGCLARFTAWYEVDIDEFEWVVFGE